MLFMSALFVLKIFNFLSGLFNHLEKRQGYFKIHDVTIWLTKIGVYMLPNMIS